LYHKQIAIKHNRKGAGSQLLQGFLEMAAKNNNNYHHVVCTIVHAPVMNKISAEFHQKHGFICLGLVKIDDMNDGVYLKHI
jgi:L-amino acid N-acyltransferase YncA